MKWLASAIHQTSYHFSTADLDNAITDINIAIDDWVIVIGDRIFLHLFAQFYSRQ
jgi:hypothetical protein